MSGEREALELVREHLPDHEPWLAWPNFEFVDEQGRVNEVELLVFGPRGLILVEINSRRGTEGDGHSWIWTTSREPWMTSAARPNVRVWRLSILSRGTEPL